MLTLEAALRGSRPLEVLCLGAHADDIEIGCGGTVLTLLAGSRPVRFHWVVLSAPGERAQEAERSAKAFLEGAASAEVVIADHRESYFPYSGGEIKDLVQALAARTSPDLVLTHHGGDRHQDHRLVSELTWNAFRDHLILEYEVPKYDGDLGSPNVFVPLTAETGEQKARMLAELYPSQAHRYWFDRETFLGLLRIRGVEARSPTRYAEAFHARKVVVDLAPAHEQPGPEGF